MEQSRSERPSAYPASRSRLPASGATGQRGSQQQTRSGCWNGRNWRASDPRTAVSEAPAIARRRDSDGAPATRDGVAVHREDRRNTCRRHLAVGPCSSHLTNHEHPVASWKEIRVDRPADADWNRRNVAIAIVRCARHWTRKRPSRRPSWRDRSRGKPIVPVRVSGRSFSPDA